MHVLVVSSSGGVLLDVMALSHWWKRHRVRWVSVPAPDTQDLLSGRSVTWSAELRPGSVLAVVGAVVGAVRDLRARPVGVIVSAGSGVAVPWFVAGWLCRIPRVWVETLNVRGRPGLAARTCAALASTVIVQHPDLLARHRRALYVGELY